jgi:hypothetical protein
MQKYKLQVMKDDEISCYTTRDGRLIGSIIDVTQARRDMCNDLMNETLSDDDDAILSD